MNDQTATTEVGDFYPLVLFKQFFGDGPGNCFPGISLLWWV